MWNYLLFISYLFYQIAEFQYILQMSSLFLICLLYTAWSLTLVKYSWHVSEQCLKPISAHREWCDLGKFALRFEIRIKCGSGRMHLVCNILLWYLLIHSKKKHSLIIYCVPGHILDNGDWFLEHQTVWSSWNLLAAKYCKHQMSYYRTGRRNASTRVKSCFNNCCFCGVFCP